MKAELKMANRQKTRRIRSTIVKSSPHSTTLSTERDKFFVVVFDKVSKLRGLGWEVWLGFAPTRFDENIAAWAVADEAVVKRLCASGHLLFYYLVEVGGFVFVYGLADPTPIPGRAGPLPFLKEVDPSVCPVATAVKRGVEALASLYEAVIELEQVDPLQLSHIPIRLYPQLCQRPALERLCKKARAIERLRKGEYKAEEMPQKARPSASVPLGEEPSQPTTTVGGAVGNNEGAKATSNGVEASAADGGVGAGGGVEVGNSGRVVSSCSVEELLKRCSVGGECLRLLCRALCGGGR